MFVGASCSSFQSSSQKPSLYDSGWILESVNGGKEAMPHSAIFLSFRRDRIWGFAGCNDLEAQTGSTIIDNHSLKLSYVSYAVGCSDGRFETEYHGFINRVASYQTDGKSLSLFDESGQLLLTYHRDDAYLKLPPTPTPSISIPCNQPGSNC